jgi:predicted phosphodiesterase
MEAETPVDKGAATLPIRILHLSDIHFRPGRAWDSDPVLRHLARFVASDASAGLAPDLVVLTGDLAFSGQADEYELARTWLERELWPALSTDSARPLSRDRLLLVPGNHDVDRGAIGTVARMVQDGLIENQNQNEVAEVLGDAGHREVPIRRHAAYLSFYGSWLGGPQTVPWWQKPVDIRGQRVHVAGLDSAWMASGDADRGRLIIGRWQLNQTVDVREAEGADWRLALLHHPWDYFAEFDLRESRQAIRLHRDLLLRGHLHEGEAALVRPADPERACLELAAGCLYESSRYANAFQWIELYAEPRRVRVLFRLWNEGAWQVDRNQPGCPDGEMDLPMGPTGSTQRKRPGQQQAPIGGTSAGPKVTAKRRRPGVSRRSTRTGSSDQTRPPAVPAASPIRADVLGGIAESLDLVPALRDALALRMPGGGATTAGDIAERLCAPAARDFLEALSQFRAALEDARKSICRAQGSIEDLRGRAHDILGWMVVTTVMDGYDAEDAPAVRAWLQGQAFHVPIGRSPCLEVLSARWLRRRARFGVDRTHRRTGEDDITPEPKQLGAIGLDDPFKVEQGHVVNEVWRLIYQRIDGGTAPLVVNGETKDRLRRRLEIRFREERRRLRLVVDAADLTNPVNMPSALRAIGQAIPLLHLLVTGSAATGAPDIFLLPAGELAGDIDETLARIDSLQQPTTTTA